MANEKNLMSIDEVNSRRTREQHSNDSRKAGQASGKARREKKAMRELAQTILSMPVKKGKKTAGIDKAKAVEDLVGKNLTVQEVALLKIAQSAMRGNTKDLEFLRDTAGEKPKETIRLENDDQSIKEMEAYFDSAGYNEADKE